MAKEFMTFSKRIEEDSYEVNVSISIAIHDAEAEPAALECFDKMLSEAEDAVLQED